MRTDKIIAAAAQLCTSVRSVRARADELRREANRASKAVEDTIAGAASARQAADLFRQFADLLRQIRS